MATPPSSTQRVSDAAPATDATHTSDAPHACTCLGHCCASTPVNVARSAESSFDFSLTGPFESTGRPQHEFVAAWVTFILPFATAPPRSLA